jgi:hypothetical protein
MLLLLLLLCKLYSHKIAFSLQVNPTVIVDKLVSFWVNLATPGRGAGQSNW